MTVTHILLAVSGIGLIVCLLVLDRVITNMNGGR